MISPSFLNLIWQRCVPNMEPIVYNSRVPTDTYTSYNLLASKRKKLDEVEADVGVAIVESGTMHWQIWAYHLNAAGCPAPRVDDYFVATSDNTGWSIVKINIALMGQRYDVTCSNRE